MSALRLSHFDALRRLLDTVALPPDVVFFGIQMPGLNGLDAATALAD